MHHDHLSSSVKYASHNAYQQQYYENALDKKTMQVAFTPYIMRHVERMWTAADLHAGQRVLEVGAGLGKFSVPLVERGLDLTCLDISAVMLERLQASVKKRHRTVTTVHCDVADAGSFIPAVYERAVGFFTLHHMHDLKAVFRGVRSVLLPGARVSFCEPVGHNPLYYLQVSLMPGMRWAAEKGFVNMRRKKVFSAMKAAGLKPDLHLSYGFFPPFVVNRPLGTRIEDALNRCSLLNPGHAFQIFSATVPK